ncbi:MAG: hypothetical protein AAGG72_10035 [Pseudomonadota bacterium]
MLSRGSVIGVVLVAVFASHIGVYIKAYRSGVERTEARHAASMARLNDNLASVARKHAAATKQLLKEKQARAALQEDLDNEARVDRAMDDNGLPASSVRRINVGRGD